MGLWGRMDESAGRDIDIVSNDVVLEDGLNQTILNDDTGSALNIIHVDNTNTGAEDGSFENPYNTLVEAEEAAGDNDLIYVNAAMGRRLEWMPVLTFVMMGKCSSDRAWTWFTIHPCIVHPTILMFPQIMASLFQKPHDLF